MTKAEPHDERQAREDDLGTPWWVIATPWLLWLLGLVLLAWNTL